MQVCGYRFPSLCLCPVEHRNASPGSSILIPRRGPTIVMSAGSVSTSRNVRPGTMPLGSSTTKIWRTPRSEAPSHRGRPIVLHYRRDDRTDGAADRHEERHPDDQPFDDHDECVLKNVRQDIQARRIPTMLRARKSPAVFTSRVGRVPGRSWTVCVLIADHLRSRSLSTPSARLAMCSETAPENLAHDEGHRTVRCMRVCHPAPLD